MIKIIGGKYKKTNLEVPFNFVRPTSALKREAIFSTLESYAIKKSFDLYKNKAVLDLYAGTGSLGLEAISRGMSMGYFYEKETEVIKILKRNCLKICKDEQYEIRNDFAENVNVKINSLPISIIFIDPPYKKVSLDKILQLIIDKKLLNNNTSVVVETHSKENIIVPNDLNIFKEKFYGKTKLIFLN